MTHPVERRGLVCLKTICSFLVCCFLLLLLELLKLLQYPAEFLPHLAVVPSYLPEAPDRSDQPQANFHTFRRPSILGLLALTLALPSNPTFPTALLGPQQGGSYVVVLVLQPVQ